MTGDERSRSPLAVVTVVVLCAVLVGGAVGVSGVAGSIDAVENAHVGVFGLNESDEAALAAPDAADANADRGGFSEENTSTLEVVAADDDRFRYRIVVEGAATSAVVGAYSADREDTIRYNADGTVTIAGATGDGGGDAYVVTGEIRSVQVIGNTSPYRIELDDEDVTGDIPAPADGDDGNSEGDETDGDGVVEGGSETAAPVPDDGDDQGDPPDDNEEGSPADVDPDPSEDDTETAEPSTDDTETPEQPNETPESDDETEQPDDTPQSDDAPDREIDSCTVVDEPGRYDVTDDLAAGGEGACLHVRSPDVVLDGNGNSIVGDGNEDSTGILVLNGTVGGDAGDPLTNVTVRDVRVTEFDTGVQAGSFDATGTSLTLVAVDASGNAGAGVYFNEVDDSTLREITANDNRHGVLLWETYDIEVRGLGVEDNDGRGLYLAQNVGRSTFSDVRAVGNGGSDGGPAIRLSADVVDNVIVDSIVADNDGPGVAFSDSADNMIRDTTIEDNAGSGVVGDYPGGDRLERVTLRGNGDPQLEVERGELGVTAVAVGEAVTVSFADGVAELGRDGDDSLEFDTVDRGSLPGDPPGAPAASEALSVSGATVSAELSFDLDGTADPEAVDLWRYDGDGWRRVAEGTATDGQFTATVDTGGVLVPLESTTDPEDEGTTGTPTATPGTPEDDETGTETTTPEPDDETTTPATKVTERPPMEAVSGGGR